MSGQGAAAVVIGAGGGLGAALARGLRARGDYTDVVGLARSITPFLDLQDEASVRAAAERVAALPVPPRLILLATGVLHGPRLAPEKALVQIDPEAMAQAFAVNAIGPALVMKHFLPLLPRPGRSVFAALSARVGSIGDNRLGGWYSYRASKAALNQIVRTAAVEVRRRAPEAVVVALHPGTVATPLSAPFSRSGPEIQTPDEAAARLLGVIDALSPEQSGGFFDHRGQPVPW
jgi:NAD(P)-dependent dehydrogenase (short-subunit alcohol dehydrogenase family)